VAAQRIDGLARRPEVPPDPQDAAAAGTVVDEALLASSLLFVQIVEPSHCDEGRKFLRNLMREAV